MNYRERMSPLNEHQWTPEEVWKVIGAVGGLLTLIFGKNVIQGFVLFWKEIVVASVSGISDWLRHARERRIAERLQFAELNDKDHKHIVFMQDKRITQLEEELRQTRAEMKALTLEHITCQKEAAALRSKCEALEERVDDLESELREGG